MDKEPNYRDAELIDLGTVNEETHGSNENIAPDGVQPRQPLGIVVD